MDKIELERLIATGESETLEFKQSTAQLPRAMETVCAFLNNAAGGTAIIGVTPQGRLVGQHVADKTHQEIANAMRRIEPPVIIDANIIDIQESERKLIVLRAKHISAVAPFTYDGRAYHRIGTTTSLMLQERYQSLLLERMHSRHRWENTSASEFDLDGLDLDEIVRTVRTGIAAGRLPETTGGDPGIILDRLGLRVQGELTNAAIVLFGRRVFPDYPQCQLRMARFKGTSKTEFIDNRQINGNSFVILDEAMLFLQRHLPVAGRILPGLFERVDEPLFPLVALREALVNAICHRDYSRIGGAVSLAIYDDRLEIWSDGALPFGLHVQDLKRDHLSHPRNPLIADVFYRRGLVERWGRGTQMIVELCVRAGHPEPEFLEQAGAVGVRFLPSGYIAPHRVAADLTPRQREILHVLAQRPAMPLREIRLRLTTPLPERTLQFELSYLRRLELIDSGGRGRSAVYWLRSGDHDERRH